MQRTLIITAGGIGDSICLIPLLKRLRTEGQSVTLLYFGTDSIRELLDDQELVQQIVVNPDRWSLLRFCLTHFRYFDQTLITHLFRGGVSDWIAMLTSKKTIRSLDRVGIPERHELFHYLECFYGDSVSRDTSMPYLFVNESRLLSTDYVLIQPFAGNGKAPYKQWTLENWRSLLSMLAVRFPHLTWVIVGEKGEEEQFLIDDRQVPHENLIGKTSLTQLRNLAAFCSGYIGVDTGLMHLVAAVGKPTITLWGGSNHRRYGYDQDNPVLHRVIRQEMSCHPCNDWFKPNRSRVSDPSDCPDFACIRSLQVGSVWSICEPIVARWFTDDPSSV